jgi:competence protein ComEC
LVVVIVFYHTAFLILAVSALVGICLVSFRQAALNNQFLKSKIGSVVRVEGVITSDPVLKEGLVIGSFRKPDQLSALFKLTAIDGRTIDLPLRIRFNPATKVEIDQNLILNARLVKSKERKVAALAIANDEMTKVGKPRNLFRFTSKIRDDFRRLVSDSKAGALIPGLVLVDTSLQAQSFTTQMGRVGLSHLTAVSGANFAMVATFLFWLLQYIIKSLRNRLYVIGIIFFYLFF